VQRNRDVDTSFLRPESKQTVLEINGIPSKVCGVGETQASEKAEKNQTAPIATSRAQYAFNVKLWFFC
jgi:hypothetical protein